MADYMAGQASDTPITAATAERGTASSGEPIAVAQDVTRDFASGSGVVRALRGVSLVVRPGELIALRGRSGSGKTTLLNILTGLDNPTTGHVRLNGQDLAPLSETARALLRRDVVGMMFRTRTSSRCSRRRRTWKYRCAWRM